jgi:DNA-binding transcriptional LysR family regulator
VDDLNEIAIYARVVERKSFSAAAKELHLSPSVVSKRVTALEERLGVLLLNRSTRRLSLTEAGNQFYRRCAKALSDISQAAGEAASLSEKVTGRIKIHSTLGVGLRSIANSLIAFSEAYPEVSVELMIGMEPVNLIEHGVDIVIRSADLKDASIESRVLMPIDYHIVGAPEYFDRYGMPETPADLAHHNCMLHQGRRAPNEWTFNGPEGPYVVRVSGSFSTNSGAVLQQAALKGVGICHLPAYTVQEHLRDGRLISIFDGLHSSSRCLRAFYTRTRYPQPKVVLLLDFLEKHLGKGLEKKPVVRLARA